MRITPNTAGNMSGTYTILRVRNIINVTVAVLFALSRYLLLCTVSWATSSLRAVANVSWLTVRRSPKWSSPERTTRRRRCDTCRRPSRRRLPAGTYDRRENSRLFTLVLLRGAFTETFSPTGIPCWL